MTMAKLQGPLFSVSASGTVASLLCYRATTRGPVAQLSPIPRARPSFAQFSERARCAATATTWRTMTADQRAPWLALAVARKRPAWIVFHAEATVQQTTPPALPLVPFR